MGNTSLYINGVWSDANGPAFVSSNPATGEVLWEGKEATSRDVEAAITSAHGAFAPWSALTVTDRTAYLERFRDQLESNKEHLAETISKENGKPLWDSLGEVSAMINKIAISVAAYEERTPTRLTETATGKTALRHKPHGVLGVFGPFNFPGHLPNGHIVPALLAGNTVIFKPSELTPLVAQETMKIWHDSELPAGVVNLVQGGRATGEALANHVGIDGLLFTGSATVGKLLHQQFSGHADKILALELGGNNPLIVHGVNDIETVVSIIVQSAFVTSGQRCTCARRLILTESEENDAILDRLRHVVSGIVVGVYNQDPTPYMGPVINNQAADVILKARDVLMESGAVDIVPLSRPDPKKPFLMPGVIDVTDVASLDDEEVFGPLLQVKRVSTFDDAIKAANETRFGLAAGLLSDDEQNYERFLRESRAGIVNWNLPLTGASSSAPFGGIGSSGNHRPSAYYAADYCAYPVASMEASSPQAPASPLPGVPT